MHIYRLRLICRHIKIYTHMQLHIHNVHIHTFIHTQLSPSTDIYKLAHFYMQIIYILGYVGTCMQHVTCECLRINLVSSYRSVEKCLFVYIFTCLYIAMQIYTDQIVYSAYICFFSRWADGWRDR